MYTLRMTKRLTVAPHLEPDELERRYRAASDVVARSQWHMLWQLAQGKTAACVAELTGYHVTHVRQVLHRYNDHGPESIRDRRRDNPGRALALSLTEQDELRAALFQPPADGGIWTSQKVADWLSSKRGKKVNVARGWEWLKRLGFSLQTPRPRHAKADPQAQEAFKKRSLRS
jgi:transposase